MPHTPRAARSRKHTHPDQQELVMFLEPDQLTTDTSKPLPRTPTSRRLTTALWALRVFVLLLSAIVIYTFAANLK